MSGTLSLIHNRLTSPTLTLTWTSTWTFPTTSPHPAFSSCIASSSTTAAVEGGRKSVRRCLARCPNRCVTSTRISLTLSQSPGNFPERSTLRRRIPLTCNYQHVLTLRLIQIPTHRGGSLGHTSLRRSPSGSGIRCGGCTTLRIALLRSCSTSRRPSWSLDWCRGILSASIIGESCMVARRSSWMVELVTCRVVTLTSMNSVAAWMCWREKQTWRWLWGMC